MEDKMADPDFLSDAQPLLRPGIAYSPTEAYTIVKELLIDKLQKE